MQHSIIKHLFLGFAGLTALQLQAQTIQPDLQDLNKWTAFNRTVEAIYEDGKKAVRFNVMPGDGYLIIKGIEFSNGVNEFDVKGKNVVQQSFVGIALHVVDEKTYEAVYFRPFNFTNPDTTRNKRVVQYIAMPDNPWEKLRETFPGKYENRVSTVPDSNGWFHVKLVVDGKNESVFVDNAQSPSLVVETLHTVRNGGVALWVGNNSGGSFADVSIAPSNADTRK